jgi:hypothetical protein
MTRCKQRKNQNDLYSLRCDFRSNWDKIKNQLYAGKNRAKKRKNITVRVVL